MEQVAADQHIRLSTPIQALPGVGPKRAMLFSRLGLRTVGELIRHFPTGYEKQLAEGAIGDLPMNGAVGSARGTIVATRTVPGKQPRFQATLQDHSDRLSLTWFNANYLRDKLHPGMVLRVTGKTKAFNGYPQMVNPKWEELKPGADVAAAGDRLRPIYPATEDLPSAAIERVVASVLPAVLPWMEDPLPESIVKQHAMVTVADAYRMIHQPGHEDEWKSARRRLAFNELLLLQLGIALRRYVTQTQLAAPPLRWSEAIDRHIRERFPFALTAEQERVVREIADDLRQPRPMNRLLQGDVGAGKTVVALYAMLMAVADRRQGAIMAPTELLAEQHHQSIAAVLAGSNVRIGLITGSAAPAGSAKRRALVKRIEAGEIDLVIGTQALLTESVRFRDLAVVVVDEQHRFGVTQRATFRERRSKEEEKGEARRAKGEDANEARKGKIRSPHCLVMTATPIPRSLSLTVFGDLDISTIKGLPPGRTPIATRVVRPEKADDVYRYLAKRVAAGEQAYVVVPTIDAQGQESAAQLKSVKAHADHLRDKYLGGANGPRVATMHGRLQSETRDQIMARFRAGEVAVLVATTVIEVGVDVPNATLMVVEHAERFGLAQLHQLRGRIGRGAGGAKPVCAFIADPTTEDAQKRMTAIAATGDGFAIAEQDLAIRGMGDFFGTRQHGQMALKLADIPRDMDLLQLARRDAQAIVTADPRLEAVAMQRLRTVLSQQYGDALGLVDVG